MCPERTPDWMAGDAVPIAPGTTLTSTTVSVSRDGQRAQYPTFDLALAPPVAFSVAFPLDMPVVVPGAIFFCA